MLVVTQHFWPESFRINEVVEDLRDAGADVTVLTGQPNYPEGKVFAGYRAASLTFERTPSGIPVHRVPLIPRARGRAHQLVANYLSFIASAGLLGPWALRGELFDVVFVYGTSPILQAIAAIVIKSLKRAALVTWVQDLWPDSLEVTGFVRDPKLLAAVRVAVEAIYRANDLLLVQSEAFVAPVRALSGQTPIEVHANPGERSFQAPASSLFPATSPPALHLGDGFNVVFAGNLGTVQALDTILDAAEQLRGTTVRMFLVGSGSRSEWLKTEIARRRLDMVQLPGRFPPEAMPAILQQASALLVTLVRSPAMSQTVPSKVQAYLAAARPVVAALDGEGARVVDAAGAGITCPAEDAAALALAITRLQTLSGKERKAMGERGRLYYEQHYDGPRLARALLGKLEAAVQHRKERT